MKAPSIFPYTTRPEFSIDTVVVYRQANGVVVVDKVSRLMWLPVTSKWVYRVGSDTTPLQENDLMAYEEWITTKHYNTAVLNTVKSPGLP